MLEKKYNHLEVEKDKYQKWKSEGYFDCGDLSKEPFCIVIPPPNGCFEHIQDEIKHFFSVYKT